MNNDEELKKIIIERFGSLENGVKIHAMITHVTTRLAEELSERLDITMMEALACISAAAEVVAMGLDEDESSGSVH